MAAGPAEEDLGYLWRPKRTLRDWGQTNYHIIRNWTPHHSSQTAQHGHSKSAPNSIAKSSKKASQDHSLTNSSLSVADCHSPSEGTSTSDVFKSDTSFYRLRRSAKRQTTDDTWFVPTEGHGANEQGPSTSRALYGSSHNSSITGGGSSESSGYGDRECPGILSSPVFSSTSFSSLPRLSHGQPPGRQLTGASSPTREKAEKSMAFSEMEREGGMEASHMVVSDDEAEGGERGQVMEMEEDVSLRGDDKVDSDQVVFSESLPGTSEGPDIQESVSKKSSEKQGTHKRKHKSKQTAKANKKSYKKSKKQKDESTKVKLWQPRYLKRSKKDLNELDICLTVYDRVVREAVASAEEEVVQRALVSHWKGTQKDIMSVIKDLHTVMALEKRLKKEQARHSQLQKEMLVVLRNLRRCNSDYHEAVFKSKEEKQKQEALSVEAQIAAVGWQLQANNIHLVAVQGHDAQT